MKSSNEHIRAFARLGLIPKASFPPYIEFPHLCLAGSPYLWPTSSIRTLDIIIIVLNFILMKFPNHSHRQDWFPWICSFISCFKIFPSFVIFLWSICLSVWIMGVFVRSVPFHGSWRELRKSKGLSHGWVLRTYYSSNLSYSSCKDETVAFSVTPTLSYTRLLPGIILSEFKSQYIHCIYCRAP